MISSYILLTNWRYACCFVSTQLHKIVLYVGIVKIYEYVVFISFGKDKNSAKAKADISFSDLSKAVCNYIFKSFSKYAIGGSGEHRIGGNCAPKKRCFGAITPGNCSQYALGRN